MSLIASLPLRVEPATVTSSPMFSIRRSPFLLLFSIIGLLSLLLSELILQHLIHLEVLHL